MTSPTSPDPDIGSATHSSAQPTEAPTLQTSSSARFLNSTQCLSPPNAEQTPTIRRRLLQRDVWLTAAWTLVVMIRNVCVSTVVAWLATCVISRGNVFSAKPPTKQSHASYLAGATTWAFLANCVLNLVVQAVRLMPNKFPHAPKQRRGFLYCFCRIIQGSVVHLVASVASVIAVGIGCGNLPVHWRKLKAEFYIACVFTQYYYAAAETVVRRVYQNETAAGQQKRASKEQLQLPSTPIGTQARRARSGRSVRRVFLQTLPSLVSIWFAGGYIHIVSLCDFSQSMQMVAFVGVSMVIKLVVQEIAKHYVMQHNVTHIRNMCIVVGVPTVLINTQVRIVILTMSDTSSTMVGTWLMAVIEVLLRLSKVAFLRWQIRRERRKQTSPQGIVAAVMSPPSPSHIDAHTRFIKWRTRMLALHTAEIYADMYAEYIAMGCSASICFFFANNPQYELGVAVSSSSSSSTTSSAANQGVLLLLQVAIEIVVDYVSCIVEILNGIDFEHFDGFGLFLGSLFTVTGMLNVSMSAVLYLAPVTQSS